MPCTCWYIPSEDKEKEFKRRCESVVEIVHELNESGDAVGCSLENAITLIRHLDNPSLCHERKTER